MNEPGLQTRSWWTHSLAQGAGMWRLLALAGGALGAPSFMEVRLRRAASTPLCPEAARLA